MSERSTYHVCELDKALVLQENEVERYKGAWYVNASDGFYAPDIEIAFCPFCGVRLRDAE